MGLCDNRAVCVIGPVVDTGGVFAPEFESVFQLGNDRDLAIGVVLQAALAFPCALQHAGQSDLDCFVALRTVVCHPHVPVFDLQVFEGGHIATDPEIGCADGATAFRDRLSVGIDDGIDELHFGKQECHEGPCVGNGAAHSVFGHGAMVQKGKDTAEIFGQIEPANRLSVSIWRRIFAMQETGDVQNQGIVPNE